MRPWLQRRIPRVLDEKTAVLAPWEMIPSRPLLSQIAVASVAVAIPGFAGRAIVVRALVWLVIGDIVSEMIEELLLNGEAVEVRGSWV